MQGLPIGTPHSLRCADHRILTARGMLWLFHVNLVLPKSWVINLKHRCYSSFAHQIILMCHHLTVIAKEWNKEWVICKKYSFIRREVHAPKDPTETGGGGDRLFEGGGGSFGPNNVKKPTSCMDQKGGGAPGPPWIRTWETKPPPTPTPTHNRPTHQPEPT